MTTDEFDDELTGLYENLRRMARRAAASKDPSVWLADPDATAKNGTRLVGDVDFAGVRTVASLITPSGRSRSHDDHDAANEHRTSGRIVYKLAYRRTRGEEA